MTLFSSLLPAYNHTDKAQVARVRAIATELTGHYILKRINDKEKEKAQSRIRHLELLRREMLELNQAKASATNTNTRSTSEGTPASDAEEEEGKGTGVGKSETSTSKMDTVDETVEENEEEEESEDVMDLTQQDEGEETVTMTSVPRAVLTGLGRDREITKLHKKVDDLQVTAALLSSEISMRISLLEKVCLEELGSYRAMGAVTLL